MVSRNLIVIRLNFGILCEWRQFCKILKQVYTIMGDGNQLLADYYKRFCFKYIGQCETMKHEANF